MQRLRGLKFDKAHLKRMSDVGIAAVLDENQWERLATEEQARRLRGMIERVSFERSAGRLLIELNQRVAQSVIPTGDGNGR